MLLPLLVVVAGAVGGQDTGGPYTGTIAVHTGADTQVLHCTVLYSTGSPTSLRLFFISFYKISLVIPVFIKVFSRLFSSNDITFSR